MRYLVALILVSSPTLAADYCIAGKPDALWDLSLAAAMSQGVKPVKECFGDPPVCAETIIVESIDGILMLQSPPRAICTGTRMQPAYRSCMLIDTCRVWWERFNGKEWVLSLPP
jgi:hypothetical protein